MSTQTVTYQSYDSYKDSQLPWCPKVPSSWNLVPNKGLLHKKKDVVGPNWDQYTLLSLTKQGVIVRDMENIQGKFSADMSSYQRVKPGELIFCLFDIEETPRTVGLSVDDGMITGAYTVFSCKSKTLTEFLELYYIAMDDGKRLSYMYSGLRNTIRPPVFLGLKTPLPSEKEMEIIIKFVKAKTAIIDKLINKKQKLIELLQEKRQTLITQAVTKGLDPNAKMKDSGVDWIGEIPEGWKIKKIKFIADLYTGNSISDEGKAEFDVESDGFPYISTKDIDLIFSTIDYDNGMLIPKNRKDFKVAAEDSILLCIEGGSAGKKIGYTDRQVCFVNKLCCIKSRKDNRYIYYYFKTKNCRGYFELSITGLIGGVSTQRLKEFFCPYPTAREKEIISNYLDSKMKVIDKSMVLLISQIEKLSEFKSALIYNAVTGKIKV